MFVQGAPGVPGGLQPLPPMQQAAPAGFAAQPPAPYTDSAPQQNYMAQPPLPLPGALPPQRSLLESLDAQERLMDSRVLHVNTLSSVPMPSPPNAAISDLDQKQERFRKTVMAAHEIVTQKLYKAKAPSLEAYFKSVWKISRAQVYRFLDCATVLTHLEDFPQVPSHERLCRSLKRFAFSSAGGAPAPGARPGSPNNEQSVADLRTLWTRVLERSHGNNELITSTFVGKVWEELVRTGQVSRVGAVSASGEGPKAIRRGARAARGRGKKRTGRRRDSDDDEEDEEEEDFEADGPEDEEQLPFGMEGDAVPGGLVAAASRHGSLSRNGSQKRVMQPRAAVLKRSRGPDGRPNYSEDAASGISYSDEEARVAGRVSSDSDSEAAHADRSGSSQIGSMERESWAALMARSHANGGIGHHPGHPTGHQMQLHPAYPRESRFAQYREGEYYPEDSVPRAQGRHSHQAEPQFSGLHHASSLHRSGSYSGSGSNIRGGPQRSSSTSSHPSTPSTMHHGYPQTQYQTQHQSMYSQQRPPRPSSADPEVDAKRAAMARASNGHVGYTASFSSDGSGRAGYGQQGLGQGQLPASAARYGSSPSSGTRSWEQSRSAVDGSGYPHHLPVPNQHGLTLPQSNYSLMQASPHSPGASEEDEDRAPRDRLAVPAGAPQRDPSRSPDAGQVHHQPVPRRHHHLGSSGHGHPHSFSPYPRPESPRLNPTARYPSPSPNNHPQHSPGMGPNGSRNLPHIPDLQLGHGAVQHAHSHLQPHRHIPTPVSTSNSPALRPGENAYFDGPMSTQPLRGDSPEPSGGDDSMTLDALANVAMMRRMSVKNDPVLEDFGADGHGHGAMEDKDRRGALGFILN